MTVSIGIAVLDPLHDDVHSLLHRADSALYRAKANGRNRVERDPELVAPPTTAH